MNVKLTCGASNETRTGADSVRKPEHGAQLKPNDPTGSRLTVTTELSEGYLSRNIQIPIGRSLTGSTWEPEGVT